MRIRKMLFLVMSMAAVVAFSAPAVAQAEGPFWYVNGEGIETEEIDAKGTLTFAFGNLHVGPCTEAFEGEISNGWAQGEGIISASAQAECATNLPECSATVTSSNLPWGVTTGEGTVSWKDLFFHSVFSKGCNPYGLPDLYWGGTLTGQWDNETGCIVYEEAGSLSVGPEYQVVTDGELCLSAAGGPITLE